MKPIAVAFAAMTLAVPSALAQIDCGVGLPITISPASPCIGEPITITMENQTGLPVESTSACLFQYVRKTKCMSGQMIYHAACSGPPAQIPYGSSLSQIWDQTDDTGAQVAAGKYAFEIFWVKNGSEIGNCCFIVEIKPVCCISENYGTGSAGTGGFTPEIATAGGDPQIGNASFQITVDKGRGGAAALTVFGFGPGSIVTGWGEFLIDGTLPLIQVFHTLGGNPGGGGTGTAVFPFAIPNNGALVGFSIYGQTLISDPFSSGGISHTPGLHVQFCQ